MDVFTHGVLKKEVVGMRVAEEAFDSQCNSAEFIVLALTDEKIARRKTETARLI